MAILDQFGNPHPRTHRGALEATRRISRNIRARYDAAQTTAENTRHWINADGLSARAANSAPIRATLRNRSRYEAENNSYAKGIVLTLANDTIGDGPRLRMDTGTDADDARIENDFQAWADQIGLAEKLRTMRIARAVDGETFAQLKTTPGEHPVTLDIELIEADEIATPALDPLAQNQIDGIEFDQHKRPAFYHRLKYHPGGTAAGAAAWGDFDKIAAAAIIHSYRADRPGQLRGIPEITPALPLFALLRRYTLAVLAAAETAADFAAIMYTDSPVLEADDIAESAEDFEELDLVRRGLLSLPAGWKISQLKAEQPASSYKAFKGEILNEIARCLNMPFNVAVGNSAGYNYASGRLDHQTYYKAIRVDQSYHARRILDPILAAYFDEAALLPGLLPGAGLIGNWRHTWGFRATEHVDPSKEANAAKTRCAIGTSNPAREMIEAGLDPVTEMAKAAAAYGLTLDEYRAILIKATFNVDAPARLTAAAA